MTDATLITIVAAIPTTIAAVGALLVSVANAKKAAAIDTKADTIIGKAVEIHTLTNSATEKLQAALAIANEKIVGLEKLVASMTAANVATVAAATEGTRVRNLPPIPNP